MPGQRDVVYANTDRGLLVLPLEEAERLAAIHDAVWSVPSFGKLRACLPPADPAIRELPGWPDGAPIDQKAIPGLEIGDWPGLPEGSLKAWFPELMGASGLARFLHHQHLVSADEFDATIVKSWDELRSYPNERFDDDLESDMGQDEGVALPDDPLEVFRAAGYVLREDTDLVARAAGFNPAGVTLIPRSFPDRWALADRQITYNMLSSDSQDLFISWCGGEEWEVTREPRIWDDSPYELIQDGGDAQWDWVRSGCLRPANLLVEVTDTHGLTESPYGYGDPDEFLDDLQNHAEPRLRELGRSLARRSHLMALIANVAAANRPKVVEPPKIEWLGQFVPAPGGIPRSAGSHRSIRPAGATVPGGVVLFDFDSGATFRFDARGGGPGTWAEGPGIRRGRDEGAVVVGMPDGRVLVVGGDGENATAIEVLDREGGAITRIEALLAPRPRAVVTPVGNERVAVIGGRSGIWYGELITTELVDLSARTSRAGPELSIQRANADAHSLGDDRVIVMGGSAWAQGVGTTWHSTTEIVDFRRGVVEPGPEMPAPAGLKSTSELRDGRILILCGWSPEALIFDPRSLSFETATGLGTVGGHCGTAIELADGRILKWGGFQRDWGSPRVEVWDLASPARLLYVEQLQTFRTGGAIGTLLPSGVALLAGGLDHERVYDPTANVAEFFVGIPETVRVPDLGAP